MENKKRFYDDQEPSSSKTPKLNRLDDGAPEKTPEFSIYSNDEPQQANMSESSQSIRRSERLSKQKKKKDNISSDDAAMLNKENSAEKMPKRKLSVSDADAPPAKRGEASDIGTTDKGHGLKNILHGVAYQLKLLILTLLHAAKEIEGNKEFKCFITTEDPKFGKFDDIVFSFKNAKEKNPIKSNENSNHLLCIQAKHKADDHMETKPITWNGLKSTNNNAPYSISKYFNSYIQQNWVNLEQLTLVLCTNTGLHQEVTESMVVKESSFDTNIVDSIFDSLQCRVYEFNIDEINKTDSQGILKMLQESSDFESLAKQLAKHICECLPVDFSTPLFKRYRHVIQNRIATQKVLPTKVLPQKVLPNKFYKVNLQFFKEPGTKKFKNAFETEYRKLIKIKNQDIWSDVKSKGISLKKERGTQASNLPIEITHCHMENFLKSFKIVCNTLSEQKLSETIVNMLKNTDYKLLPPKTQSSIALEAAYNKLSNRILNWMKDKVNKRLEEQDINEFLEYFASSLRFLHLEGISHDNCGNMEKLNLKCKKEILEHRSLYSNLVSEPGKTKNNDFKVEIFESNDPTWVVYDTLELIKCKLNYLFLKDSQFELSKRDIMKFFINMTFPLILVIEGKSLSNIKGFIEGWLQIHMYTKTLKKIILIDQTCSVSEPERDLLFRDLTDESKQNLFNQTKNINFFGTETSTGEFIHDEDKLEFVVDVLQLPSEKGIKSNKLKESYENIENIFIHRKWEECDKHEVRESSSSVFWDAKQEGAALSELFPVSSVGDEISYDTFFNHFNIHTEQSSSILLPENTEREPPGLERNTQDQLQSKLTDCDKSNPKMHVIFNEAGSGKSFYLTWLAQYLQGVSSSWWIIKFNLNEYSMLFDQFQDSNYLTMDELNNTKVFDQSQKKDNYQTMDELIAIRFLFQLIYLAFLVENRLQLDSNKIPTDAQKIAKTLVFSNGCLKLDKTKIKTVSSEECILLRTFEHKFNSKQIVILMDSFDEIAPDYKTVVFKLLSRLKTFGGICKVYLSSRPYGLRNEVETTLEGCACYSLMEFDDREQCIYVHKYLLAHFDGYERFVDVKQARTCQVVYHILKIILQDIMANALFLSMGVEQLMPMVKNHLNVQEETICNQIIQGCDDRFELLSWVENFVEKKLNIKKKQKTGLTSFSDAIVDVKTDAAHIFEKVRETHSLLAMYTIFSRWDMNLLLPDDHQQKSVSDCMKNVNNALDKSGLVERVVNDIPIFNHRLFAEYFAALWFYSAIKKKAELAKIFVKCKVYEANDKNELKQFLDRLICKNSPLHMAVLNGSKDKIESILKKDPSCINAKDEWGRTPLQLAFLINEFENRKDIAQILLHYVHEDNVIVQDTCFEWFTLDYAYCADIKIHDYNRKDKGTQWYCVCTLLKKVIPIDAAKMLSWFSTKDHFKMCVSIASEHAHDELSGWVLNWRKEKGIEHLEEQDINEFFCEFSELLQSLNFEIMSNDYCRKIQNFELEFKREVLTQGRLNEQLDLWVSELGSENSVKDDHKVDVETCNYPPWVVFHTLQLFESNLTYLFFEDRQFENARDAILKGFIERESPHILVIECRQSLGIDKYMEKWVKERSTKTFKKILLIGLMFSATIEAGRDFFVQDLTDESKERVINQTKNINLFGTETSTGELIHDEDKLEFVVDVLQLPSGKGIKNNKLKESYENIKNSFVDRRWEKCDKNEVRETSSNEFWSARIEGTTLTKLFPISSVEDKISYQTFLDYNKLDMEKFSSILLHSNREYTPPPGIDGNTKVHVIFNEAGSGKSFYLTWLAQYLQGVSSSWWVIKFNLLEYSMEFDQLQQRGKCETMDELIAIRFLFQLVYLAFFVENNLLGASHEIATYAQTIAKTLVFSNGCLKLDKTKIKTVSSEEFILLRTFEHKFNSKQIVILMDGFDEITPHYKTVVLNLLSRLKTFDGICKLYLSSRPYGLRNEIETTLEGCACYRLMEFDDGEQCIYMHKYLLKHLIGYKLSVDVKQARTCQVVFHILKKILQDIMANPLLLSMGIKQLMPMVKNHLNVEEETIFKQIIAGCENSFEPRSMVESFVEKKMKIPYIEKVGLTLASFNSLMEKKCYHDQETIKRTCYSLLALYAILYEDDIRKLLTTEQQNSALQYMEDVTNGLEKSGLIEGVGNNTPIFNHMLFADYFAAFWFYSNQNVDGVKDFLKREIYKTNNRIAIAQLLDRMICRNSPLHMAVLDGSKVKVDNILTKEPHSINARDEWGRTPLQLAISLHAYMDVQDIIELLSD